MSLTKLGVENPEKHSLSNAVEDHLPWKSKRSFVHTEITEEECRHAKSEEKRNVYWVDSIVHTMGEYCLTATANQTSNHKAYYCCETLVKGCIIHDSQSKFAVCRDVIFSLANEPEADKAKHNYE